MKHLSRIIEGALLALILLLAAYLRLANVAGNPGWYSDEGTFIDIARNILAGHFDYMVINQSTMLFAKLPLFPLLLAGLFGIFGVDILVLRFFTGSLGVLSVLLLYLVTRRMVGPRERFLPLLAALLLAIYPQAVIYSRLGFSYNLLAPLGLLVYLGLWEYLKQAHPGWLALAALAVGLGGVSDLMMFTFTLPLLLVISARRWYDALWALPLIFAPFGIYVLLMLLTVPQAFLFDLQYTADRLGAVPLVAQLSVAALNHAALLARDAWLGPAIIGLFMLRPARLLRLSLVLFLLPLVALERTTGLPGLGFYYISPLFPFLALGVAGLVRFGTPWVMQTMRSGLKDLLNTWGWQPVAKRQQWWRQRVVVLSSALAMFLIVISPFLLSAFITVYQVENGLSTAIDEVLLDMTAARQTVAFVNGRVAADDVVIASPGIAWAFAAQVADFQQAVAVDGIKTQHLPADIPPERFKFDPRPANARYVVIDNLWRTWAVPNMAEVAVLIDEVEQWPLVFEAGQIQVYQNPAHTE